MGGQGQQGTPYGGYGQGGGQYNSNGGGQYGANGGGSSLAPTKFQVIDITNLIVGG
jgi:hypothetical protein